MTKTLHALLLATLAGAAGSETAQAGIECELQGARSLAMGGAHRAVGTSNDTLYLNPAGMAIVRRYALDVQYGYDAPLGLSHVNVSAVDSKYSAVAGGLAYSHDRGGGPTLDANLNRFYGAIAYALSDAFAFGLSTKHVRGSFKDPSGTTREVALYSGDLGMSLRLGDVLGFGLTYQNAVETDAPELLPHALAGGVAVASGGLILTADVVRGLEKAAATTTYQAGAEYFLQNTFPVRLGWQRAPFVDRDGRARSEDLLSGGVGWMSPGGGLDVGYAQSLERVRQRRLVVALRMFL